MAIELIFALARTEHSIIIFLKRLLGTHLMAEEYSCKILKTECLYL